MALERETTRVGVCDWGQTALLSDFVFFEPPLTNYLIKVTVGRGIIVGLHEDAYSSHFIVDTEKNREESNVKKK
jgi:hypothetical protein